MSAKTLTPERALTAAFLLSVFLLALSPAADPDLWMHLSLGREIASQGGLPATEPHVYPAKDLPFFYTSWLFGLGSFLTQHWLGISGLVIAKALVITAAFALLLMDIRIPRTDFTTALALAAGVLLASRYRFVLRPDVLVMVALAFQVFVLNRMLYRGRTRLIWLLPLMALLWANVHSSILVMPVAFVAYLAGGLIHRWLAAKGFLTTLPGLSNRVFFLVAMAFIACLAASLVNPNGVHQLRYPLRLMNASWYADITELQPPTWQTAKAPFIIAGILLFSVGVARMRVTPIHLLLAVPFVALAFTSLRYQFLLAFVAGPIIARALSGVLPRGGGTAGRRMERVGLAFCITTYTALAVMNVGPLREEGRGFGLGWDPSGQPEAALSFMDAHGIQGRVLNQFHWGGYLTWRDFPRRRPFLDNRGHVAPEVLDKLNRYRSEPQVLDDLESSFGIDAMLIEPTLGELDVLSIPPGTDMALEHTGWALVYWDDVSLVYLKKNGPFGTVAREQAYRFVRPGNRPPGLWDALRNRRATEGALADIRRALGQADSSIAHALLGSLLLDVGRYEQAASHLARVKSHPLFNHKPFALRAEARARLHLGQYDHAARLIRDAAGGDPGAADHHALGVIASLSGDAESAVDSYRRALKEDPSFAPALMKLLALQVGKGRHEDPKALRERLSALPGAALLTEGERELRRGRYDRAFQLLHEAARTNPSNPEPYLLLADMSASLGQWDTALQYQMKALAVDPFSAEAHRQVAVTLTRLQNPVPARAHRAAADTFSTLDER